MATGPSREDNYTRGLGKYFRILFFADFIDEVDSYDLVELSIFAIGAIMILIILMNLLISIIGDSHERIYSTIKNVEGFLLCDYIFRLEVVMTIFKMNRKKSTNVQKST